MTDPAGIRAGPVGRGLRFLTGVLILVAGAGPPLMEAGTDLWIATLGIVLAELFFYLVLHWVVQRFFRRVNPWIGAVLAVAPVMAVYVLAGPPGQLGTLVFIGVSLLFTGLRADGGCEVMTLPGMIFGKRTHLVCIAFSPVDWLEGREVEAGDGAPASGGDNRAERAGVRFGGDRS